MAKVSQKRKILIGLGFGLLILAGVLSYIVARRLDKSLGDKGVAEIRLKIVRIDSRRQPVAGPTVFPMREDIIPEGCPFWQGGDFKTREMTKPKIERAQGCEAFGEWSVLKHPIAFSLYAHDAGRILDFFKSSAAWTEFQKNPLVGGYVENWRELIGLKTPLLEKSVFQGYLIRTMLDTLLKNAGRIDYDLVHGRGGLVFSFRNETLGQAIALGVGIIAHRVYKIGDSACKVQEFTIGPETFYLAGCLGRTYLGLGLPGLLNVMDQPEESKPEPAGAFSLVARGEAFFEHALEFVSPKPNFPVRIDFDLGESGLVPLAIHVPRAKPYETMTPEIAETVYQALPKDLTSFALASIDLAEFTSEAALMQTVSEKKLPFASGKAEGKAAVGIIWDLNHAAKSLTEVGLIVVPSDPKTIESWVPAFEIILGARVHDALTFCKKDSMILIASTPMLLTRMKESCQGNSKAISLAAPSSPHNAEIFFDPGNFLRELFLAGGGDELPEVKAGKPLSDEQKVLSHAKEKMSRDTLAFMATFPRWYFAGQAVSGKDLRLDAIPQAKERL